MSWVSVEMSPSETAPWAGLGLSPGWGLDAFSCSCPPALCQEQSLRRQKRQGRLRAPCTGQMVGMGRAGPGAFPGLCHLQKGQAGSRKPPGAASSGWQGRAPSGRGSRRSLLPWAVCVNLC